MNRFWVVCKHEYLQVVKKKSFIIGILLIPAMMAAFMILPAYLAQKKSSSTEQLAVVDASGRGLGEKFAKSIEHYKLDDDVTPYYNVQHDFVLDSNDTEREAAILDSLRLLVTNKQLTYFLVINKDPHLIDSNLYLVTNSDRLRSINRFEYQLSNILSALRLEQTNINLPIDSVLALTASIDLNLKDTQGQAIPFQIKYIVAMVFVMIMFGMMIGYGALVMRSVIEEKTSRIMEVLVSSVSPFQLMLGKVFGLGGATLTQVAIWLLIGAGISVGGGMAAIQFDPSLARILFNPMIVVFFPLLLITGYLMISTLYALIGSIVTNEKEAQGYLMPINLSILLPVILMMNIVQEPNSVLATTLSFLPPFAPTMMMMRIAFVAPTMTEYSFTSGLLGEAILSYIVIVISTILIIWLTGKIFRVGILMYGKRPTLPELIKWIKY